MFPECILCLAGELTGILLSDTSIQVLIYFLKAFLDQFPECTVLLWKFLFGL